MKLFLVLVVLLFEVPAGAARPKKCFSNIVGYCRKKCAIGEIYEVSCLNGKLCCVNEGKNKKYQKVEEPHKPFPVQSDQKLDYEILPTVTLVTIQF
ncbi:defensin beta 128 [Phyllostomus discolor]|uniref:Beta-defensin n=1 Tax=Phyllostomus discolor TaxID=89673 RepID=A0A834DNS7_9CHIR|nr:defensin beta 128 [Phyllostomus discolor]